MSARLADHPKAFTRTRKLPLPTLVGALLSMRNQAQQAMLDAFFGSLAERSQGNACDELGWQRGVSGRGFAKARSHLDHRCLDGLNTRLVKQADAMGLVARWNGLRVVAGDASALMPALRPCHTRTRLAGAHQQLFSLVLPGCDLTLHASVHGLTVPERQMLFEALDALGPDDVLVLDRGYPAGWLVALLNERGIRYCMRCDKANGWVAMRALLHSGQDEMTVTLRAPGRQDALDYECSGQPPTVRLVRVVCPNGRVQVVATNLPAENFPCAVFAELYHQRWRIEEGYKRLKHRAKLESMSGLTQQALLVDVAAKVLADNMGSLLCLAAGEQGDLAGRRRVCNRAYAAPLLQRVLPRVVLGIGCLLDLLEQTIQMLAANTHRRVQGRAQPRPRRKFKPHPHMAYKG